MLAPSAWRTAGAIQVRTPARCTRQSVPGSQTSLEAESSSQWPRAAALSSTILCTCAVASRQSKRRRTVMQARTLKAAPSGRAVRFVDNATVESMQSLLEESGLELLVSGSDRQEKLPDGKVYCYLPIADLPGVPNAEVRLLCSVDTPRAGMATIEIEDMAILLEDARGNMVYDEKWSSSGNIDVKTTNVVRYTQASSRLRLEANIRTEMQFPLPNWFPIPDQLFRGFVETFTKGAFRQAQEGLLDKLQERLKQRV
mmetsp:Transcript_2993/g.6624  ORF Transcript_2993/g.6624 Transcript_2993/m.6624 type:complete len:256 (+) Transcript_2993:70-837(+)